ncbi:hypothetical protein EJB10_03190 [Wolbachia endosymbiont of Brugia malayi]|uniref:hypothetical protein n=1 Tax=Wolbachia endosymbiont of Brugia malayi TaxID=80849 RepID=UPI00004C92D8|nr:hypothetical protein [Wolbachia endosymbiont of Brugia malayi]AAW70791.1 Predicted protein [Wolbachia endosymbiont strain TRS of Brugia malayi]QCB61763.1 hypothetical protein EJB10_03190 [Wolbachia endosymbiont of Brugia malayi]
MNNGSIALSSILSAITDTILGTLKNTAVNTPNVKSTGYNILPNTASKVVPVVITVIIDPPIL